MVFGLENVEVLVLVYLVGVSLGELRTFVEVVCGPGGVGVAA